MTGAVTVRNAIWSYVTQQETSIQGPTPKLAQGTGRTGTPAVSGYAAILPGYVSEPNYFPTVFDYGPPYVRDRRKYIPQSINVGDDGLHALNPSQRAHDFTVASYFPEQMRSPANWQQMSYPPDFRNTLQWQQVQKYRVFSSTIAPRMLDSSSYFLGYAIDPSVAAAIGGNGLGSMGG